MPATAAAVAAVIGGSLIQANAQKQPRFQEPFFPGQSTGVTQLAKELENTDYSKAPEFQAFEAARRAIRDRAAYNESLLPRKVSDAVANRFRFGNASLESALSSRLGREASLDTANQEAGLDIQGANLIRDLENRRLNIASILARGVAGVPGGFNTQSPSSGAAAGAAISGAGRLGLESYNTNQQSNQMAQLIAALQGAQQPTSTGPNYTAGFYSYPDPYKTAGTPSGAGSA